MLCSMLISYFAIATVLTINETKSKTLYTWIPAQFVVFSLGMAETSVDLMILPIRHRSAISQGNIIPNVQCIS
jgi:hypothetical protein